MRIIKGEKRPDKDALTTDDRFAMARLSDLKREMRMAKNRVDNFKDTCDHIVFHRTSKHDVWEHNPDGISDAICLICDQDFGWACPDSRDGACHYPSEIKEDGGMVTLNDGSKVTPDEPESGFWSESCVFCGHPEERK